MDCTSIVRCRLILHFVWADTRRLYRLSLWLTTRLLSSYRMKLAARYPKYNKARKWSAREKVWGNIKKGSALNKFELLSKISSYLIEMIPNYVRRGFGRVIYCAREINLWSAVEVEIGSAKNRCRWNCFRNYHLYCCKINFYYHLPTTLSVTKYERTGSVEIWHS